MPFSPQTQTSASSSPCCVLLMTSATGYARPMGRRAPGPTANATPASSSSAPSLRRRRSPTLRACYCAHAHPRTRAAGNAGATPSPPAARCRLGPPTAWSCGACASLTRCAGAGAGCGRAGAGCGRAGWARARHTPLLTRWSRSCARLGLPPTPGTVERLHPLDLFSIF